MKYFGTDGIRSSVNGSFLNENFAVNLGEAVAKFVKKNSTEKMPIIIGRDTRKSGESLLRSFSQGLNNQGLFAVSAGVVPTPVLAHGVIANNCHLGVMITASHNPQGDNGFKFFSQNGTKLSEKQESIIEKNISQKKHCVIERNVDSINITESYIKYILKLFPEGFLRGLKIVADLSNGATSTTTPKVLSELGAEVTAIHCGDGKINDGVGSEYPSLMAKKTNDENADFGIAHDGDGDRTIFSDSNGQIIEGDKILGLLALHEKTMGRLNNDLFVATIHSNSGLQASLEKYNISVLHSDVGDKKVAELMRNQCSNFGGESSGHLVASDFLPTGDGLLTAILIARVVIESKKDLRVLSDEITLWPSYEGSFVVKEKIPLEDCDLLKSELNKIKSNLKQNGRILVRYSGTESKIRLLVEAIDQTLAESTYNSLAKIIKKSL